MDLAALGITVNPHGRVEQRVACPHCSKRERDDVLGVNIQTGAYHCFRCGWKGRAGGGEERSLPPVARIDDPAIAERKRERLRRTWSESVPLTHASAHAVRAYLQMRALGEILKDPPRCLRAHPGLDYWDGSQRLGRYPAMVALFQGAAGDPVTVHVTYLRHDGCAKAAVPAPKKVLSPARGGATRGGAIRLYEPRAGVLGIAEGIESALSLRLIRNIAVWSTYCADNLERVRLPRQLRELQVGVDVDPSGKGRAVAEALAKRVRSWSPKTRVTLILPDEGADDLNSELMRRRAG